MRIRVSTFGKWPRDPVPDGIPNTRVLRRQSEQGTVSETAYQTALSIHARELHLEQEQMEIDFLSEGWLRWDDPYNGTLANVDGFIKGRLTQDGSTNTLFERPLAVSMPQWHCKGPSECDRLERVIGKLTQLIPYRTGPLTLAAKTESLIHATRAHYALHLAQLLREELRWLLEKPWRFVHLAETNPSLDGEIDWGFNPLDALGLILKDLDTSRILLSVDCVNVRLLRALYSFPMGALGINFTHGDIPFEILENFPPHRTLFAGIVSGTISKRENMFQTMSVVRKILHYVPPEHLILTSGGNLYVSRSDAIAKMRTLVTVARMLEGQR